MENKNHTIVLVGVCGTGKSTIGQKVSEHLGIPFFDVDTLFTPSESSNSSLPQEIDLDKWLNSVEDLIKTEANKKGCVISCSILKKKQRLRLTENCNHKIDWVFMNDTYENVAQRLDNNNDHDRPISVVKSDFETLEIPKRALTIDMSYPQQETVSTILKYLARKYG
ncbi:shikimate kinase [Maribacter sp. LLG6340-A2]|uniref:shikimate kinase n=1 Tax=Maribacter sp. LLG6340-A2 TaxID=3160834 RepID=UPI00386FB501